MVVLGTDKKEKEKDDLFQINKLLNENGEGKGETAKETVKLGVKYRIASLPQIIWTDCYGNELQKGDIKTLSAGSTEPLQQQAKAIIEKQKKLEKDLIARYKASEKQIEKEKEKKEFSTALINELQPIAQYDGWESALKAKSVLGEVNTVAGEELNKILEQLNKGQNQKEKVVEDLNKFAVKYEGLPIAKKAKDKVKELSKK